MRLKDLWALLKDSWNAWSTDKAPRLGAALAYYTTFLSLGWSSGQDAARDIPNLVGIGLA